MRTKITIVFETHGLGTVRQANEWSNELLDKIAEALELPGLFELFRWHGVPLRRRSVFAYPDISFQLYGKLLARAM
jgi:hypothetical protein